MYIIYSKCSTRIPADEPICFCIINGIECKRLIPVPKMHRATGFDVIDLILK